MHQIWSQGIHVEWMEIDNYLAYMLYCEGSAVQAVVQVSPHIVDTAILYVSFLRSPLAQAATRGEMMTESRLDGLFSRHMQGKAVHRLRDARALLSTCEPQVLAELAAWRKQVHYLYANSFAQSYLLHSQEWVALRGVQVVLADMQEHSLQTVVVRQVMRMISEAEIIWSGEVPKMKKLPMSSAVFKDICICTRMATKCSVVVVSSPSESAHENLERDGERCGEGW